MATNRVDSSQLDAIVARANLSASEMLFAKVGGSGELSVVSVSGDRVDGVIIEGTIADRSTTIQTGGIAKVKAGAAVTRGSEVMSNDAGKAITATGAGSHIAGVALETAAAEDEVIPVQLRYAKVPA